MAHSHLKEVEALLEDGENDEAMARLNRLAKLRNIDGYENLRGNLDLFVKLLAKATEPKGDTQ